MAKVTGMGGFFIKTSDKEATARWFSEVLELPTKSWGRMFPWREQDNPEKESFTVLGLHATDSDYYGPSTHDYMLNLRVDDLDGMLAKLRGQGVEIVKIFDQDGNGRFAHVKGPDGMVIELWQPADDN